jgi:hypothetical protein
MAKEMTDSESHLSKFLRSVADVKQGISHVVMWSCGHVVMWSCGHVVMWSCDACCGSCKSFMLIARAQALAWDDDSHRLHCMLFQIFGVKAFVVAFA